MYSASKKNYSESVITCVGYIHPDIFIIHAFILLHRGDEFRTAFARLGEVRSLIPPSVGVMALTATATRSLRREVVKTLGMIDPVVASCTSMEDAFIPLMEQLEVKRTHMDRVFNVKMNVHNFICFLAYEIG